MNAMNPEDYTVQCFYFMVEENEARGYLVSELALDYGCLCACLVLEVWGSGVRKYLHTCFGTHQPCVLGPVM